MKKPLIAAATILFTAVSVCTLTGCNGTEDEIETTNRENTLWMELLNVIPENDTTIDSVTVQNIALQKELSDRFTWVESYPVFSLSAAGTSGLFSHYYNMTDPEADVPAEYRDTIGFTLEDVDQMITSGVQPYVYEAYRGSFDTTVVENAVTTGNRSDELEYIEHDTVEYYRWGEDNLPNLELRSNVRPLGRGHRLAILDDFAFWTVWDDGIEDMIDSYTDASGSLADKEEYQLLAEGLDTLSAFSACITTDTGSYEKVTAFREENTELLPDREGHDERFQLLLEEAPLLKPYTALATGVGLDRDGYYLVIVLLNPDEATARENSRLLEKRITTTRDIWQGEVWSDLATGRYVDNQGRLTLARLWGQPCEFWTGRFNGPYQTAIGAFEPLLVHE